MLLPEHKWSTIGTMGQQLRNLPFSTSRNLRTGRRKSKKKALEMAKSRKKAFCRIFQWRWCFPQLLEVRWGAVFLWQTALGELEENALEDFYNFHSCLAVLNAVSENELSEYAARIIAVENQLGNITGVFLPMSSEDIKIFRHAEWVFSQNNYGQDRIGCGFLRHGFKFPALKIGVHS